MSRGTRGQVREQNPETPTFEKQELERGRESLKQTDENSSELYREHQETVGMKHKGMKMAEEIRTRTQDDCAGSLCV